MNDSTKDRAQNRNPESTRRLAEVDDLDSFGDPVEDEPTSDKTVRTKNPNKTIKVKAKTGDDEAPEGETHEERQKQASLKDIQRRLQQHSVELTSNALSTGVSEWLRDNEDEITAEIKKRGLIDSALSRFQVAQQQYLLSRAEKIKTPLRDSEGKIILGSDGKPKYPQGSFTSLATYKGGGSELERRLAAASAYEKVVETIRSVHSKAEVSVRFVQAIFKMIRDIRDKYIKGRDTTDSDLTGEGFIEAFNMFKQSYMLHIPYLIAASLMDRVLACIEWLDDPVKIPEFEGPDDSPNKTFSTHIATLLHTYMLDGDDKLFATLHGLIKEFLKKYEVEVEDYQKKREELQALRVQLARDPKKSQELAKVTQQLHDLENDAPLDDDVKAAILHEELFKTIVDSAKKMFTYHAIMQNMGDEDIKDFADAAGLNFISAKERIKNRVRQIHPGDDFSDLSAKQEEQEKIEFDLAYRQVMIKAVHDKTGIDIETETDPAKRRLAAQEADKLFGSKSIELYRKLGIKNVVTPVNDSEHKDKLKAASDKRQQTITQQKQDKLNQARVLGGSPRSKPKKNEANGNTVILPFTEWQKKN